MSHCSGLQSACACLYVGENRGSELHELDPFPSPRFLHFPTSRVYFALDIPSIRDFFFSATFAESRTLASLVGNFSRESTLWRIELVSFCRLVTSGVRARRAYAWGKKPRSSADSIDDHVVLKGFGKRSSSRVSLTAM